MNQAVADEFVVDQNLSAAQDADLEEDVAYLGEEGRNAASEVAICADDVLFEGVVVGLPNLPILLQLPQCGLLIQVLRYPVELDPLDQVLAQLHEGVPARDAVD